MPRQLCDDRTSLYGEASFVDMNTEKVATVGRLYQIRADLHGPKSLHTYQ